MIRNFKIHNKSFHVNPLKLINLRIFCIYVLLTFNCSSSFSHEIKIKKINLNKRTKIQAIYPADKFEKLFYSHSKPYIEEVSFFGQVRSKLGFTGKSFGYKDQTIGWESSDVESYLNDFLKSYNGKPSELNRTDISSFFTESLKSY